MDQRIFPVLVLGDMKVGKTSLFQCFKSGNDKEHNENDHKIPVNPSFSEIYSPTIGIEFHDMYLANTKGNNLHLLFLDCSGNLRYRNDITKYYNKYCAILLIFDVTNRLSFDLIDKLWLHELKYYQPNKIQLNSIILIGTKCDMSDIVEINELEHYQYAKSRGIRGISRVSSKTGLGIKGLFRGLLNTISKNYHISDEYSYDVSYSFII